MSVHVTDLDPSTGEDLLDGLNPQQREAVLYRGPSLLIVAGAGSGKTSVLTRRIAGLIHSREMKVIERYSELGPEGKDLAMLLLRLGRGRLGH